MRWLIIPLGVVNVALGASFLLQRPVDHQHLTRTHGMNLDLSPPAKLFNRYGSSFLASKGRHKTSLDVSSLVSDEELKKEAELLTRTWASASSPLAGADPKPFQQKERSFLLQFSRVLDHPACFFSP